jgi:FtsZ-binding cell division protein ZapB
VNGEDFPQQFEKLENRIEQLVKTCEQLQMTKTTLEGRVADLEAALQVKNEAEQNYREEKTIIRSKVDDLLGRLDKVLEST